MKIISVEKKLADMLFKECTENVEEVKTAGMALFEHGFITQFV